MLYHNIILCNYDVMVIGMGNRHGHVSSNPRCCYHMLLTSLRFKKGFKKFYAAYNSGVSHNPAFPKCIRLSC